MRGWRGCSSCTGRGRLGRRHEPDPWRHGTAVDLGKSGPASGSGWRGGACTASRRRTLRLRARPGHLDGHARPAGAAVGPTASCADRTGPAGGRDGRVGGAADDGPLDGWVVRGWRVGMRSVGLGGAGGGDYAVPSVRVHGNRDLGRPGWGAGAVWRGVMRWCHEPALAVSRRGAAVGERSGGCALVARSGRLTEGGDEEVPPAGPAGGGSWGRSIRPCAPL